MPKEVLDLRLESRSNMESSCISLKYAAWNTFRSCVAAAKHTGTIQKGLSLHKY